MPQEVTDPEQQRRIVAGFVAKEERCKRFRREATLCQQHGVVQKEYVVVPDGLLKKTGEPKRYFDTSYDYVVSMKPKAAKKNG